MSSTLEVPSTKVPLPSATPQVVPRTRPLSTRILHLLRRGHLYLGLALFPWAILYGFTAFIFNHPAVLSDLPVTYFTRADLVGTPLENPPSARDQAAALVDAINENRAQSGHTVKVPPPSEELKFDLTFPEAKLKRPRAARPL